MSIKYIRKNPDLVKYNQKRRFLDPNIVDDILIKDKKFKEEAYTLDLILTLRNKISKSFKNCSVTTQITLDDKYTINNLLMDLLNNEKDILSLTRDQLKLISKELNSIIAYHKGVVDKLRKERDNMIHGLGNDLHKSVPISNNEKDNGVIDKIINETGLTLPEKPLSHIDLLPKLGFINTDDGIKVAGNRGYFITGFGVRLNMALINYALDFLEKRDYKLMSTPHIVDEKLMKKITQLSDYQETLYKLDGYDKYLIATSEQPLTAYFSDKRLKPKDLPIKLGGISSCYRKETGAHGRNTRGIYRVHEFEKIEQFCVTDEDTSWKIFDKMINVSREFYDSLGLSYQIVNIVSGELNNAASMKYDLEAWFPGSDSYCELVSCTNCLDYFSRRINTTLENKKKVHMLNCTLCANTRTLCCLVENYQTDKGFVVPKVLRPYLGGKEFVEFEN